MKKFNELSRRQQESSLLFPLIKELKRLGGQATTKELKRSLVENIDFIPENALTQIKTSKNGNLYHPFDFPFNFAIKKLTMAKLFNRPKVGTVTLTETGRTASYKFEGKEDEFSASVYQITDSMWKKKWEEKNNKTSQLNPLKNEKQEVQKLSNDSEEWRQKLQTALNNLTPAKFEEFCRQLIKKMGVDIDEKIGVNISGDGGIDGYGYLTNDDFRTTRVAIQAKRWNSNNMVSSPEIDKFRGAMDKFRAEYGIFLTTSSFTRDAIKAARSGTRIITLIDGERLLDLTAKYRVFVTPKTIYELDDEFFK